MVDRLKFGIMAGYPMSPAGLDETVRRAQWAEDVGFDFVGLGERVLWRHPMFDTFVVADRILAATTTLKVGFVFVAPLRHPVIASKLIATLDQASSGRLLLWPGIGGDYPSEFRNCGIDVSERVGRTDETLEILKRTWAGETLTFDGRYYQTDQLGAQPMPHQSGGPPMWLAHRGRHPASVERTVRLCDGWLASWVSASRFETVWQQTCDRAEEVGADPGDYTPAAIVRMIVAPSTEEARRRAARWRAEMYGHAEEPTLMEHLLPLGTAEQCAEKLQEFIDAGVTHFVLSSPLDEAEWDEQHQMIVEDVLPRLGVRLTGRHSSASA